MPKRPITVPALLDALERHYGEQTPWWPVDPYEFLVWWASGYPQSDERCAKGFAALKQHVGIAPPALLAAKPAQLAAALKSGGMVPELRALRLKEIAMRTQDEFGGDLDSALRGATANGKWKTASTTNRPMTSARKILKSFRSVGDPGADRILLFAGMAPLAAVPSNNPAPLVRILHGRERDNYGVNYRQAQHDLDAQLPPSFDARTRAYMLLKVHGQQICKSTKPKCDICPVRKDCAYYAGAMRGRGTKPD